MSANNKKKQQNNRHAPSFSVHDEIKRDRRIRQTGKIRRARSQARALFTFVLCVFVFLLITAAVLFTVMRVKTVTVSGNVRYTAEEIINAADINGAVLPLVGEEALEKKIVSQCPYVNDITLTKKYPSGIDICVFEAEAIYAVKIRGEIFSLDKELRVIEKIPDYKEFILLSLPTVRSAVEGRALEFYKEADSENVFSVLNVFMYDTEPFDFSYINLADKFNISAIVGDSVKIEFGNGSYLSEKLRLAKQILVTPDARFSKRSLIDVSEPSKPSALYDYDGKF